MREPAPTWVAVAALALGGCSFIYDAGTFTASDGAPPDAPIDAQIKDANIDGLELTGTEPVDLAEGAGCVWDGGACTGEARAIPIVVDGSNIDPSATVTLDGAGFSGETVPAFFDENHDQLAIAVRIPPDLGLAAGDRATLTITVAQGTVSGQANVPVAGLDDFVASVDAAGGTLDIDATPLAARYATIDIDADIRFAGSQPVRLTATSSLTLGAALDVSGSDAGNASSLGAAGPGGCDGAVAEGTGSCEGSGGGSGGTSTGGGGGGHRTAGHNGVGMTNPGAPGALAGDVTMAPLGPPAGSRGNGGGGGGNSGALSNAGGAGGGGGGTLVLTSGGSFTVTSAGILLASGGSGGAGAAGITGCAALNEHGGGGGGGSGGAVLLRGWGPFADEGGGVAVDPGQGGDDGCVAGGDGADGRVRIDLASADADPGLVSGTSAFRGIAIDPALPPVVTEAQIEVGVFGAPNQMYQIQVEGHPAQDVVTVSDRTGRATVTLDPGQNRICVLVNGNVTASSDEGAQCVTIAFMPP
jgi:hypothetical protein